MRLVLRPAARSASAEPREEGLVAGERADDRCEEPRADDLETADRRPDDLERSVWRGDERETAGREGREGREALEEREADDGRDEERAWPPRLDGRRDAARGFSSCPKAASAMNPQGSNSAIAAVRVAACLSRIGSLLGMCPASHQCKCCADTSRRRSGVTR